MPRANSLPRNTLSISILQALQNTGDKFSNGERSNQIRHGDRERLPACTIQDTLYFMSCAGRDKWVSVAEGIVEIWRCKEVVSAASSALTSKTSSPVRVAWQSYIINVPSTSHTLMHNDSCGEILIYPVLGISVSYTADSLSVSFHCTLKKRRSQTPDNAPCCRLHHDSCIHLQWRKLTWLKHLQV